MINDNIKVKDGKYICTIVFHPIMIISSVGAIENYLFLKSCREAIETHIWRDYETNYYTLKIAGKSLTNILRTRFEIINYFIKAQ